MSVHQTKTGIWYCQYRVQGKKSPKKEYFGKDDSGKRKAQIRDAEVNLARAKGQDLRNPDFVYPDKLAQMYIDDCRLRGASDTFIADFKSLMNKKVLPEISHIPVNKLTYADIVALVQKCWPKASFSTQQRYLEYMRTMFRFGLIQELTISSPLSKWKKTKERRKEMNLTFPDLAKIMQHAAPHLAWIIEVEWELGARPGPSELFTLQWRDFDPQTSTIHIRGTKTETSDRVIPITPQFCKRLLEKQKEARTEYIIEYKGNPVRNNVLKSLRSACKAAEIPYPVRLYDIRHLFATTMLTGGLKNRPADLAAVSRLLGHADISTTQKNYYHLMKDEMTRATSTRPSLHDVPDEIHGKISESKKSRYKRRYRPRQNKAYLVKKVPTENN